MAACALRPTAAGAASDLHAAVGASELAIFRKCGAYALGSRCGSASLVTSDSWLPSRRWLQASSKAGDPPRLPGDRLGGDGAPRFGALDVAPLVFGRRVA